MIRSSVSDTIYDTVKCLRYDLRPTIRSSVCIVLISIIRYCDKRYKISYRSPSYDIASAATKYQRYTTKPPYCLIAPYQQYLRTTTPTILSPKRSPIYVTVKRLQSPIRSSISNSVSNSISVSPYHVISTISMIISSYRQYLALQVH